MLFVTELLQRLGTGHANEKQPRPNRSQRSKIDLPSHTASTWRAIGDSGHPNATRQTRPLPSLGIPHPHLGSSPEQGRGGVAHARTELTPTAALQLIDREQLLRRSSLGASALVAGGAQRFHLSAQYDHPCSNPFIFLRGPCDLPVDRALADKALKLFIRTQAQHLFAATGCISLPQIEEHDFEQRLEFERGLRRKHSDQLFGNVVRPATRESDSRSFRHLRV